MQENCMSGLPSGSWNRNGILAVRQPITAPVADSTENAEFSLVPCTPDQLLFEREAATSLVLIKLLSC